MEANFSKKMTSFLEDLRISRKITQEDFIHDIISARQYRRYLKGDSIMPYHIFIELSRRLNLQAKHIFDQLDADRFIEAKRVSDFYNCVAVGDTEESEFYGKNLSLEKIYDDDNRLLYQYTLSLQNYLNDTINASRYFDRIKTLIDFPDVLNKGVLSPIEVLILTALLRAPESSEKEGISKHVDKILEDEKFLLGTHNYQTVVLCLFNLAKFQGLMKDYKKALNTSIRGIEICETHKSMYLLSNFYHYKALCYNALGEADLRDQALFQLFTVLCAEAHSAKLKRITKMVEKDFSIDYHQWIKDYINNNF